MILPGRCPRAPIITKGITQTTMRIFQISIAINSLAQEMPTNTKKYNAIARHQKNPMRSCTISGPHKSVPQDAVRYIYCRGKASDVSQNGRHGPTESSWKYESRRPSASMVFGSAENSKCGFNDLELCLLSDAC